MSYPAAAIGAAIGMMLALGVFASAWRVGWLPRDYDFIHDFGSAFVPSERKLITYAVRFAIGIIFHPVMFVFVWGRAGVLGVYPLQSHILSAVLLVSIEASGLAFLIWQGMLVTPPKGFIGQVIILQTVVHLVLGVLMGTSYTLLT